MTYVGNSLHRSGKFTTLFCWQNFSFSPFRLFLPLRRCPFLCGDFFGSSAPRGFPFFSLPSFRRAEGGGGSRDVLRLLPEGLPLLLLGFCPASGVEEPLVTRSVHASSLLSPRFIRGLGIQELLSCGGLLLPNLSRLVLPPHLCTLCEVMGQESLRGLFMFLVASPSSSLQALRGGEAGESSEFHSSRVPPWLPNLWLGKSEGALSPLLVGWLS